MRLNKLSHNAKAKLYCMIRNDCITRIQDESLDEADYSAFNSHWNNKMRLAYGMKENYIILPEFQRLWAVSRSNKPIFEESIFEKAYHNVFGYDFGYNVFENPPCCDVICCFA